MNVTKIFCRNFPSVFSIWYYTFNENTHTFIGQNEVLTRRTYSDIILHPLCKQRLIYTECILTIPW